MQTMEKKETSNVKSLQVESLFELYNLLSNDDKIAFLVKVDETSMDFRRAAIVTELNLNKITDPITRKLIQNDEYLQHYVIIDRDSVPHFANEIKYRLGKVKFMMKKFGIHFSDLSESWYYVFLEFDPLDGVERSNPDIWMPFIEEFEPFDINTLDLTIGPMMWDVYNNEGFYEDIMPHPE